MFLLSGAEVERYLPGQAQRTAKPARGACALTGMELAGCEYTCGVSYARCVACGCGGPCALSDGLGGLRGKTLSADMLVFAAPLYCYGMTAQLKAAVDRLRSANPRISGERMESALLAAAWNDDGWAFDALGAHYGTLVRYPNLVDCGRVLGGGCGTPAMTARSACPDAAYRLGRSL